jgi:prepilin-type N-terminal cleavage/methylation domain-containing protein
MPNKILQNNKFKKGFTLVESLIYIVIFAVISIALVESVIYTNRTYLAIRSTHSLENSAITSFEKMSRDIRNAYSVIVASSTLGVSPGVLSIKSKDGNGIIHDIQYYLDSQKMLRVKDNGVDVGKLTASTTPVSNLVFTQITTNNSTAIKVDMSIQIFKNNATTTEQFWSTYILRGSY